MKNTRPEPKLSSKDILIWDIETSPNLVFSWGIGHKVSISFENIYRERAITCIAWKILGKSRVYSLNWDQNHCDKEMIDTFIGHLNNCRYSVAHNGDRFDLRWLRGRAMFHRLGMWPEYTSVDTLKIFRKLAYLNSYRLDYLLQYFGFGRKIKVDYDLWKRVFAGEAKALQEMIRYNRKDVVALEELYTFVRQYMSPVDSLTKSCRTCPHCASEKFQRKHHRFTKAGGEKIQLQCDAGHYWTVTASRFFRER